MVVTMLAAYLPARRAGKMPPVAAMRDDIALPESTLHRRIWLGSVLFVIGLWNTFLGAFTADRPLGLLGGDRCLRPA